MEHVSRLEFQIHRLGYRFTDVDLLTEALTHSVDDKKKVIDFPLKDKSYSRLTAIGNSVLKLLASHYAIQTCSFDASEGTLTNRKKELVHVENVQRRIGKKLILRDPNGKENGDNIHNCVRILTKFWNNKDFLAPYDQFLKAVLGAVFIDAGGTSGKGFEKSMEVFIKLWKDNGMLCSSEVEINELKLCFPFSESISLFWWQNGINKPYSSRLQTLLRFEFSNPTLLCEALIQKSLYDPVRNNPVEGLLRQPDYQRLEFLGDSVLEVVIMEFMIYEHPGFQPGNLVNKMKPYVADDYLRELALKLKLNEFLKAMPKFLSETGWNEYNDLMESVIGAMFVDGGIKKTKEFILRVCDLRPTDGGRDKDPTLEELEYKLGYKFKDLKVLEEALIHPTATNCADVKTNFRNNVGIFGLGNLLIEFYASDYVLRTCKTNAKLEALVAHRGYLCGEAVVRKIAYYLQLHKLAQLSPTLKEGLTPFLHYEQFVFSIFGSIFNNAGNRRREILNSMGEIFYRLWNPYLKHCPKPTLKECFPDSSQEQYKLRTKLGYLIPDEDFKTIEENIGGYKFHTRNLLEQALTERSSRFYATNKNVGDSERFQFLGESISYLNVPQLVLTEKQKTGLGNFGSEICFLDEPFKHYASSIDAKLLKKYYMDPQEDSSFFDKYRIATYVVGAIFIDTPGHWFEKFERLYSSYLITSIRMEVKQLADRIKEMEMEELKKENTIVKPICAAEQDNTITRKNEDYKNIPWTLESQSLRINAVKANNTPLPPTISSQMKITEAKANAQHVGIGKERRAETVECKPKSVKEFPESSNYSCYTAPTPRQAGNKTATLSKAHDVELERYQGTLACDRKPHPCDYSTGEDYFWAVSMYESKKHTAAQNSKRGNVTELNSDFRKDIFQSSNVQSSRLPPQPSTSKQYEGSYNSFHNSSKPPPSPQRLRKHLDQPNPTSSTTMSSSENSSQDGSTSDLFEGIVGGIVWCVIGVLIYKWYVGVYLMKL